MIRCGGTTDAKVADKEAQDLLDALKADIEAKVVKQLSELTAHSYKTQVVAGINYFIKAHIGNNEYIHVRIYQPLPGQGDAKLSSLQENKTKEEEIEYF